MLKKWLITNEKRSPSAQAMSSDSPSPSFPKTPSTSTSPFSTLPNEIVQLIIGSSFPDGPYFAIYHLRQPVLYSLSLVSRLFRGIAQPLLFEIASTEGDMDHGTAKHEVLMLICLTNPNFSHYLKSVYFEDTGKDNWVFCRLVNSVMEECRSLASLTIRGDPPLMLWDYLAQRPNITSLALFNANINWAPSNSVPITHFTIMQGCAYVDAMWKLLTTTLLPNLETFALIAAVDRKEEDEEEAVSLAGCLASHFRDGDHFLLNMTALYLDAPIVAFLDADTFAPFAAKLLVAYEPLLEIQQQDWKKTEHLIQHLAIHAADNALELGILADAISDPKQMPALRTLFIPSYLEQESEDEEFAEIAANLRLATETRKIKVISIYSEADWGFISGAWPIFKEMMVKEAGSA